VDKKDGEHTINSSQNIELPFLIDSRSMNLGETSCTINYFDQPPVVGCHHSNAFVCRDELPSTSFGLLSSHVHYNSDLECAPVKEDIHIEASSAPHLPMCPIIHSISTCVGDTPCSLASSSYDLSAQSTQGNEFVHDENVLSR